ncbi:MAG: carboxymuconolactone decarboxylase family protein [Alphaproteobacteria bacterium]
MVKAPSSAARDGLRGTAPKLVEFTERVVFGEVWEGEELSKRDRSLITVTTLVALGHERQLRGHLQRALYNGVTREEIIGVITHLAFYAGWPRAMTGATIAKEVFAELDAEEK